MLLAYLFEVYMQNVPHQEAQFKCQNYHNILIWLIIGDKQHLKFALHYLSEMLIAGLYYLMNGYPLYT